MPPEADTPAPRLIAVRRDLHARELLALNTEYMAWVFAQMQQHFGALPAELAGQPAENYAAGTLDAVCGAAPPLGCFYLLEASAGVDQPLRLAGMGGLRRLDAQRAELKRIFVRPGFRGQGLGMLLLQRLQDDARAFGYQHLCLDSAPFMPQAQALYARLGFQDCPPYAGTEVPQPLRARWRFMQRALQTHPRTGSSP